MWYNEQTLSISPATPLWSHITLKRAPDGKEPCKEVVVHMWTIGIKRGLARDRNGSPPT